MRSKRFQFDRQDVGEVGTIMVMAGVSAALVAGLQFVGAQDLGSWGPLITAGITAAIKAIQQWMTDNSKPETRR